MIKKNKTEAIVDAISFLNNAYKGDSLAYQLSNPLLLKSYAKDGKHNIDAEGRRVFDSFLGGYKSAVWDVSLKISGKSNSGLKSTDKLRNLLKVYGISQETDIMTVVHFLRKALRVPEIEQTTPLSFFLDKQ